MNRRTLLALPFAIGAAGCGLLYGAYSLRYQLRVSILLGYTVAAAGFTLKDPKGYLLATFRTTGCAETRGKCLKTLVSLDMN